MTAARCGHQARCCDDNLVIHHRWRHVGASGGPPRSILAQFSTKLHKLVLCEYGGFLGLYSGASSVRNRCRYRCAELGRGTLMITWSYTIAVDMWWPAQVEFWPNIALICTSSFYAILYNEKQFYILKSRSIFSVGSTVWTSSAVL